MILNLMTRLKAPNKINLKLAFALFLSGCSLGMDSLENKVGREIVQNSEYEIGDLSQARYLFIRGELALRNSDFDEAREFFEEAKSKSKKLSPTIEKRLAQLYIKEGDLEKALKATDSMEKAGGDLQDTYRLRAGILNALGRSDESIQVYQQLVQNSKIEDEESFLLLSGAYIQSSKFEEAIKVLEDLHQRNPESFVASYYLAKLYASLKDFEPSLKFYKSALNINPTAEQVQLEYIKVLVLNNNIDLAIAECKKLVAESPENDKAKKLLDDLLLGDKKIASAIQDLNEAKVEGKSVDELQFKVALLKLQQRDFKGAESEFLLLLSKNPDYDEARYYLATTYASQEKLESAVAELKIISSRNALYKKARGFASFLLRQDQKFDEAIELINESLEKHPNDIELLGYKTAIQREMGNTSDALKTLEEISKIEPENEEHLFNLGVALEESGDKEGALKVIENVLVKNPDHANALNYIGYTLAEKGKDLHRAEELLLKAIAIEKNNGFFLDSLGWIYFKQKNFEKSRPLLEQAASLTNGDPVILEHLAEVYLKLNQNLKAKETFMKALDKLKTRTSSSDIQLKNQIEDFLKSID